MKYSLRFSALLAATLLMGRSAAEAQPTNIGAIPIPASSEDPPAAPGAELPSSPPSNTPASTPGATVPTVASQNEPDTWATRGLKQEIQSSLKGDVFVKFQKKPSPKARLSPKQVSELQKKIATDDGNLKIRQKLAEHFEAVENWDAVAETLRPVFEKLPRKALISLARAYGAQKNHLNEIRVLETLIAQKKNDFHAVYLLGEAYAALGRKDEALNKFEESRKINARFLPPYEALLREAKRIGRFHDSIQALQDMIKNFGDKAAFNSELCLLYAHEAFLEKAFETCQAAIAKNPKHVPNHVNLGLVARDKDGSEAAEKILRKAAQQFPKSELAQWAAGEVSWERRNYPAAFKYFSQAVKAEPTQARSQFGLARAAFELQKYETALPAFVESCKRDRVHLPEFRKSAAILRQKNNSRWSHRFDAGLAKCGIY